MRAALGVVAALALALAVGGAVWVATQPTTTPEPSRTIAPTTLPTSPVDGFVVDVDSRGLTDVRGFTIRTTDGQELTFTLDRLENAVQFPPGHLVAHAVDALPVRVTFVVEGNVLSATRLEDAP